MVKNDGSRKEEGLKGSRVVIVDGKPCPKRARKSSSDISSRRRTTSREAELKLLRSFSIYLFHETEELNQIFLFR